MTLYRFLYFNGLIFFSFRGLTLTLVKLYGSSYTGTPWAYPPFLGLTGFGRSLGEL